MISSRCERRQRQIEQASAAEPVSAGDTAVAQASHQVIRTCSEADNCPHCGESLVADSVAPAGGFAGRPGFEGMVDPTLEDEQQGVTFDPMYEQHAGIVLGISIANIKHRDESGRSAGLFSVSTGR